MRSLIVGTAGHIDHGKSALVRALTGTDPDRLKEEKERGITIDLGFAHTSLSDDVVASFVDVPGHERFVRNMLAGAHGIDAVLLVVAADESVMPQTREHFHICRLLGIERGLIVLTKCDVADAEMQALSEIECRELVAASFLEGAPLLRVSARSGAGLDALRAALREIAAQTPLRSAAGIPRLPVDRAFTLHGFGTVATGTVVAGRFAVGDEIEVVPERIPARIRGIQVHGSSASEVAAGSRAALNLAGLELDQLARGAVLASPGALFPTSMLDVLVSLLPGERPLRELARVRVHVASAEVLGRVRLLGSARVLPGETALAQLRLERPVVACRGDRLVLRSYSPALTIGGAQVLDPLPPKRSGVKHAASVAALRAGGVREAAVVMVREAGVRGVRASRLASRLGLPLQALFAELKSERALVALGQDVSYVSGAALETLRSSTRATLEDFHGREPLRPGMPKEELRRRSYASVPDGGFELVLQQLQAAGEVKLSGETLALARYSVSLSPAEAEAREALLAAATAAGIEGIELKSAPALAGRDAKLLERVAKVVLGEGLLVRVGDGFLLHRAHLDDLKATVRSRFSQGSKLDVAAFKQLTGLSRKFVIPLLEFLDRERVTRRAGPDRYVL